MLYWLYVTLLVPECLGALYFALMFLCVCVCVCMCVCVCVCVGVIMGSVLIIWLDIPSFQCKLERQYICTQSLTEMHVLLELCVCVGSLPLLSECINPPDCRSQSGQRKEESSRQREHERMKGWKRGDE
ncbi:hypothetical protein XENOCAPTIV_021849 [Xenoophorus captivus]|uniref:NADH dehydrogenase subunit 6 n=1 Tax=Xenoophorus captivus TaxID=1517983 RepID=A0ABV0S1T3_9TELE